MLAKAGVPANYAKYDKRGGSSTDLLIAIKSSSFMGNLGYVNNLIANVHGNLSINFNTIQHFK